MATVSRLVSRSDGLLDWTETAVALWRRIRAFAEWPQGFTFWNGRKITVSVAAYDETLAETGLVAPIGARTRSPVAAAIGTGAVSYCLAYLPSRRRPTPINAFLRGHPEFVGARLRTSA